MNDLLKKAIAECIGTFVLVFFAVGTAVLGGGLVGTAIAFGLVIVAMAYSIGRISGCHINPAVSLGMLIAKKMTVKEFFVYVCSQIVGGLLGAVLLFAIIKMAGGNVAVTAGSNLLVGWDGKWEAGKVIAAFLVEIVLTFVFVYVIFNATSEKAAAPKLAGVIIGLTLTLVHLVGINLTGTSVNPARSIATAFGNLFFTGDATALSQVWIFIIAPLAGGALAAVVYKLLHKDDSVESTDAE
ncbi:MAG: aquaporin [Acholeplasmatales bacterium]|nr:aquaporin [Acholeplasmatales bacterium]